MRNLRDCWAELDWSGRGAVFFASLSAVLLAVTAVVDRNLAAATGALFAAAFAATFVWVSHLIALNRQLMRERDEMWGVALERSLNISNIVIADPPEGAE